jgi:hypothetical protein
MKSPVSIRLIVVFLFGVFAVLSYTGSSGIMGAAALACLVCGLFALVLPKFVVLVNPCVWLFTGLVILVFLFIPPYLIFSSLAISMLFLIPLALVNVALLLHSGLSLLSSGSQLKTVILSFIIGILLVIKALFNLYYLTVWDNTYDALGYIWLFIPIFAVFLSGLTLLIALPSRTKLAGVLYLLLLPVLMVGVSARAQSVDFRQVTTQRAERVVEAMDSFYAREGKYPNSLAQLTPWYLLTLPQPVIIYGQDWCYEGGDDHFRLGYVDRKHWSDPRLIGRIFIAEGQPSGQTPMCNAEVIAIQQKNPDYLYTYWMESE